MFDVRLCNAAGFVGVYHLLCVNIYGELCLIKTIPLKTAMGCGISFVNNVCDNKGKQRVASI